MNLIRKLTFAIVIISLSVISLVGCNIIDLGCKEGTLTADDKCSFWGYEDTENGQAWVLWNTSGGRWERLMPNIDDGTFQVLEGAYAKDKNRVYWQAHEIEGADPASFEIIETVFPLSRDSRAAYDGTREIVGARPESIRRLSLTYSSDGLNVYSGTGVLVGADADTFEAVGPLGGRDKHRCYIANELTFCDEEPFISKE